jgi:hypothetical protein
MAKDPSQQAKQFIDASLKGRAKPPSKAAYTRAVRLAKLAFVELTVVATRLRS